MGVFAMPSLGADMEAGTLVEWLVKPGDRVAPGDVVAVVETQKGAIEIEIFEAGVVDRLEAQVGDKLPVGAPLARLLAAGEVPAEPAPPETPAAPATAAAAPPPRTPQPQPEVLPGAAAGPAREGTAASPAARQRAAEAGIDLRTVAGTGPHGAILLADVEAALQAPATPAAPAPSTAPPAPSRHRGKQGLDLDAMRAAIAAAMARSKREIPHYYLAHTIDLQAAADWLAAANAERPPERRLLMGALLVKATALAARAVPAMNGHYEGGFQPAEAVHAGVAVALRGGGLIAPAIRDAHARGLDELMAAMRDLVARARTGRLRSSEMTDGTITVSSMGETGAEALFGVIYPPQVALVGFGAPVRRPWVVGDALEARTVVTASLAADHRASDGRLGARFLAEIERALQEPEGL
jgi:pyruvate dehydrogenase E2 component (dihydrolipoamide acetyltransferase)